MKIKTKMSKVLGVVLSLALLLSMAIVAVSVSAQPGENSWDDVGMPDTQLDTDVGPMAFAPDGTIYAGVLDEEYPGWSVWKSEDGGFTWTETALNWDDIGGLD